MFDATDEEPLVFSRLRSRKLINAQPQIIYPPIKRPSQVRELSKDLLIPSILDIETAGVEKFEYLPGQEYGESLETEKRPRVRKPKPESVT